MDYNEKTLSSDRVFNGRVVNLRVDHVLLPDGKTSTREIVEHNGGVAIVAVKGGKVVMVRQFRKPIDCILLELPAGKIDKGEDPQVCAVRELEEETGLVPNNLQLLTQIYPAPGFSSEKLYIYLATEFSVGKTKLDEDEFIDVDQFDLSDLLNMIKEQKIRDAKSICGIMMYASFADKL